jgi:biopolymer transport protein ExbD
MRMKTMAVPFAAIFAVLALVVADGAHSAVGLPVRIAKTRPCRPYEEDVRRVVVQVLRPGVVQLNSEPPLPTRELERSLEAIFRARVYRYVIVTAEPGLQFGDVAHLALFVRRALACGDLVEGAPLRLHPHGGSNHDVVTGFISLARQTAPTPPSPSLAVIL